MAGIRPTTTTSRSVAAVPERSPWSCRTPRARPPMSSSRRGGTAGLLAVPLVFLAIFFAWPVAHIVIRGLRPNDRWDLGVVGDVLRDPSTRRVVWFTTWQAAASTALTLAVGLPGAYVIAR